MCVQLLLVPCRRTALEPSLRSLFAAKSDAMGGWSTGVQQRGGFVVCKCNLKQQRGLLTVAASPGLPCHTCWERLKTSSGWKWGLSQGIACILI
jgi:hypothetical protein